MTTLDSTLWSAFTGLGVFLATLVSLRAPFGEQLRPALGELLFASAAVGFPVSCLSRIAIFGASANGTHFLGWVAGSALGVWLVARWRKLPMHLLVDAILPAVLLGSAVGRIGCWFRGCCPGRHWDGFLAIDVDGSGARIPAPLLSALIDGACFGFVMCWQRRRPRRAGTVGALAALLYSGSRFLLEMIRADAVVLAGLTLAQVICVPVFSGSLVFLLRARSERRAVTSGR